MPLVSIVIPARNEEKYLPLGLAAIAAARARVDFPVEVIVADNASTDGTAALARAWGAHVVAEPVRCIARVRNTGAAAARGEYLLTVDADSRMHPDTLRRAVALMRSGTVVGLSPDIVLDEQTVMTRLATVLLHVSVHHLLRLGGGIYFLRRADFTALGGFNETLYAGEDLDFCRRLKRLGRQRGERYLHCLRDIPLTTSARKFSRIRPARYLALLPQLLRSPRHALQIKRHWDFYFYDDRLR